MSFTIENGRLGNQIIRNLAVSLLAEKHNLKVNYCNHELIHHLGINLFSGKKNYPTIQNLTDTNYFTIYNSNLTSNINANDHYLQTKEITNFLYYYLQQIKSSIILKNPFKERYKNNNDAFVHIRLTDAAQYNPGIKYYIHAINNIKFDKLYISTDDINHTIIKELLQLYPSSELINLDEITTFQFSSTCKHIILSHGSFSAVIGYLSFFSNVYYPEYDLEKKRWFGDMFSIHNWVKLKI